MDQFIPYSSIVFKIFGVIPSGAQLTPVVNAKNLVVFYFFSSSSSFYFTKIYRQTKESWLVFDRSILIARDGAFINFRNNIYFARGIVQIFYRGAQIIILSINFKGSSFGRE